ncbi:MAG: diaminohydroxyphosphoribosylaminopyrimidine deaminase [Verrucomicrobiota bacterium]|jgi:pyrimidine deaminase RibD-like protein
MSEARKSSTAIFDRQMMELAVAEARKTSGDEANPLVGAVAVRDNKLVGTAYRSQVKGGEHAEYTLLERVLKGQDLAGGTIYTTLEPCTKRNKPKSSCVEWLIARRVARVVVGMWDPNPFISGRGCRLLREAGITVDVFPPDLMSLLEDLNRNFIRTIKDDAINQGVQEIANLAFQSGATSQRAREAVAAALKDYADELRLGQISIPEKEAGYFKRLLDCIERTSEKESLKAYIRLTAFDPAELHVKSSLQGFYERLASAVENGKIELEYVFLLRREELSEIERSFIDGYKKVARRISILHPKHPWVSPEFLRPSIVLLERQRIAFTHDRGDDTTLLQATEWLLPQDYDRLSVQFTKLQLASTPYYAQTSPSK